MKSTTRMATFTSLSVVASPEQGKTTHVNNDNPAARLRNIGGLPKDRKQKRDLSLGEIITTVNICGECFHEKACRMAIFR